MKARLFSDLGPASGESGKITPGVGPSFFYDLAFKKPLQARKRVKGNQVVAFVRTPYRE